MTTGRLPDKNGSHPHAGQWLKPAGAILLSVFALGVSMAAIGDSASGLEAASQDLYREKRQLVSETLGLTGIEAERFWPVYEAFQDELKLLSLKTQKLIEEFGNRYDDMDDAEATKFMQDRIELADARHQLGRRYLSSFKALLPPIKLARYYHIETKITAFIDAGIEEELPLIK